MWEQVKSKAVAFHRSFHSSSVIWIARLQVLFGAVWAALTAVDLAPVIGNPKYVTAWLIFSGIVTEYGRRANTREDDDGHLIPVRSNTTVNVTVDTPAAPAPASPLGPTSGNTK